MISIENNMSSNFDLTEIANAIAALLLLGCTSWLLSVFSECTTTFDQYSSVAIAGQCAAPGWSSSSAYRDGWSSATSTTLTTKYHCSLPALILRIICL